MRIAEGIAREIYKLFFRKNPPPQKPVKIPMCLPPIMDEKRMEKVVEMTFTFKSIFKLPVDYDDVSQILIDKKYLSADKKTWIMKKSGYKAKMVYLFNTLQKRGYLDDELKITHQQIRAMYINSFGIDICIHYIKHKMADNKMLGYIPYSKSMLVSA